MLGLFAATAFGAPILDTWRPTPLATTATIDALHAERAGEADFGAWFDGGFGTWYEEDTVVVQSRMVGAVGLGLHLGRGFVLEAGVPMVLSEIGVDPETGRSWPGTALASTRLRARAMRSVTQAFSLGIAVRVETPSLEFGTVDIAENPLRVGPELIAAVETERVWFGMSGGAYLGALDLRTGFAVNLQEAATIYVEAIGAGAPDELGVEARLGGRVHLGDGFSLEAGGGYGIVTVPGIPTARVFGAVRVAPRKPAEPEIVVSLPPPPPVPPAPVVVAVAPVVAAPVVPVASVAPAVAAPSASVAPLPAPAVAPSLTPAATIPQPLRLQVGFNGDRFKPASVPTMDAFSQQLLNATATRVRLEVHMAPDPAISDDFEETQVRADLIRDAMMARGVSAARIEAMGFGAGALGQDVVDVVVIE